jgi:hypothetical protein
MWDIRNVPAATPEVDIEFEGAGDQHKFVGEQETRDLLRATQSRPIWPCAEFMDTVEKVVGLARPGGQVEQLAGPRV